MTVNSPTARELTLQEPDSPWEFMVQVLEHPGWWVTRPDLEEPELELYTDERIQEFLADDEAISDEELGRLQEKIDALARQKGIDPNSLPSRRMP